MESPETNNIQAPQTSGHSPEINPDDEAVPKTHLRMSRVALVVGVVIVIAVVGGMIPRFRQRNALRAETIDLAIPTVTVVSPAPGKSAAGLQLPAEIKPYQEAPIYARASGYLKRWLVDIGAHVEAGQLLAEIDAPELNQQLEQARAELAQSEAALALAKSTAERWANLLKTSSVSDQDSAEKQADYVLKTATVNASKANLHRLEEMISFTRVTAPFGGTITSRTTDIGELITAGSGKELYRLAQTQTLRVYVRVPQTFAQTIIAGQTAEVTIPELPSKVFNAKVVRTSGAMSVDSRTLLTELEMDNSQNQILSGSYAQVRFNDAKPDAGLTLPSNALLFRAEGLQVGVVQADGKVELRKVEVGRDFGSILEILGGVSPTDRVILNPSDSLVSGVTVKAVEPRALPVK